MEQKTLTITRILHAPREIVFAAWTDPAQLMKWWGPGGFSTTIHSWDVRPGGHIHLDIIAPDRAVYPMSGTFQEIVRPEKISFLCGALDAEGRALFEVMNTVTFITDGPKTKLTMHAAVTNAGPDAAPYLAGMETGWNQSLDRLTAAIEHNPDKKIKLTAAPGALEVIITRVLDAPRELVFEVCTNPKHIPNWWGPGMLKTVIEQMDLRYGGTWRFVQTAPDGTVYAFHGVYHSVSAPHRLVYTFEYEGTPGHVILQTDTYEEQGGRTTLTTHSVFQSAADRDGMLSSGMEYGANEGMIRLEKLLMNLQLKK